MSDTDPILGFALPTTAQAGVRTTIADALVALSAAGNGALALAIDDTNTITVASAQWTGAGLLTLTEGTPAPTGVITVTVPMTPRLVTLANLTSQSAEVAIAGQSADPVTVAAGAVAFLASDGADVRGVSGGGGGGSGAYDFGSAFGVEPAPGTVITRVQISRDIAIPADMAGSTASVVTPPAAAYVVTLQDDGVAIGTITIDTGGAATFATPSGADVTVAAGACLTFVTPVAADGVIAGLAVGIRAEEL